MRAKVLVTLVVTAVVALIIAATVVLLVLRRRRGRAPDSPLPTPTNPPSPPPSPPSWTDPANPVIGGNFPDPCVIREGSTYYAYCTDNGLVSVSTDLQNWTPTGPGWPGGGMTWAPDVQRLADGTYFLTWSSGAAWRIQAATATSPVGPFAPLGTVNGIHGIDSNVFVDDDGQVYMYWCAAAGSSPDGIVVARFDIGTLSVVGPVAPCINAGMPEGWITEPVREGPCVRKNRRGEYVMLYSGNATGPLYGMGFATATSPMGPWTPSPRNPAIWGTRTPGCKYDGTGHGCIFDMPDGTLVTAFHANVHPNRDMCVALIDLENFTIQVPRWS